MSYTSIRVFFIVVVLCVSSSVAGQGVSWHVSTDRSEYLIGETVTVMLEACNTGALPQVVDLNQAANVIDADGIQRSAPTLLPFANEVEIASGACHQAVTDFWDQRDAYAQPYPTQVAPGWYRGEHSVSGGSQFLSSPFLIRQPTAVPISPPAVGLFILTIGLAGLLALRRHHA